MSCPAHSSRSLLKGSDTAQPRILALQHLTQPNSGTQELLQGLWMMSMPKNLCSQGTLREGQGKGQSTEHRTQTPHLVSLQLLSLPSSQRQVSSSCWVLWAAGGTQSSISHVPNSWLPFPSLLAGQRQLPRTEQPSQHLVLLPCLPQLTGASGFLFFPLNITRLES